MKCILWDLDGTLVESESKKNLAHQMTVKSFGGEIGSSAYFEIMGNSSDVVAEFFIKASGIDVEAREYRSRYENIYNRLILDGVDVVPGVKGVLDALSEQGFEQVIVSSSRKSEINAILTRLDLADYFKFVVSAEDVKNHKPHLDCYEFALRNIGSDTVNTLVFEDTDSGILAAKKAKLPVIAYRHSLNTNQSLQGADLVVSSFSDSQKIINDIKKVLGPQELPSSD